MNIKKGLGEGPFSNVQKKQLEESLSGLDAGQLQWLSGFLSGILQSIGDSPGVTAPAEERKVASEHVLYILYGTHTGNCEQLAGDMADRASGLGVEAVVENMATFKSRKLKDITHLVIIVSTHGIGEPPIQAEEFYNFLHSDRCPGLSHLNFSVLALGDSSYAHFCQTGRDFDAILEKNGGNRLHPRVDCDVDYEEGARQWMEGVLKQVGGQPPAGKTIRVNGAKAAGHTNRFVYDRKNPFKATVLEKINLNGKGSTKETLHLELDLEGSGIRYEPGDALGIYGLGSPALVEEILKATHLDGNETVSTYDGEKDLASALTFDYELSPLTTTTLTRYAELTHSKRLETILADNQKVMEYLHGRDVVDLIREVPCKLSAEELITLLRKNAPRMYSIASSQDAVEDEVHLLVAVVRYSSLGRYKGGLCSTTLADRLQPGDKVKVFLNKNSRFRLPHDPDTPVIMVGPGTGVAPFRGFMQQREATGSKGKSWLFFGDRHFTTDFLYQTEWQRYLKEGTLTRMDVAFSRDQAEKAYVQHKMLENGKMLYDWLENGAHFYVCGDALHMAKDVDAALQKLVALHGGKTPEKAGEYIKLLQVNNRYQTDTS